MSGGGGAECEAQVQALGAAAPAAAALSGCPVAHLAPAELFTRRFRLVMCPLRRRAVGHAGLDGAGMGGVQKIHDGGSEEMVKDTGGGGATMDGLFG